MSVLQGQFLAGTLLHAYNLGMIYIAGVNENKFVVYPITQLFYLMCAECSIYYLSEK